MTEEQRVTKQHPIPQQVLGVEFKIIGNLTLKQFGYLAICGLLGYVSYILPLPSIFRYGLALFFILLGGGLALVPINDQPMDQWIISLFRAIYAPTQWVWRKTAEPPAFLITPIPSLAEAVGEGISPEEAQRRLREYLATIREEEALEPIDITEKERLEGINLKLREVTLPAPLTAPPPVEPTLPPVEILMPMPAPPVEEEKKEEEAPMPPPRALIPQPPEKAPALIPPAKAAPEPPAAPPPIVKRPPLPHRRYEESEKLTTLASTINYAAEPVLRVQRGTSVTYVTALQNVRVGRKFRPIPEGKVAFAPVRERVIAVEEKPLPSIPPSPPAAAPAIPLLLPPPPSPSPATTVERVPPKAPAKPEAGIGVPSPAATPPPKVEPTLPNLRRRPALAPKREEPELVAAGRIPNVISGTVYDEEGEVIEGALVTIKDSSGEIRRATKTNQLGKFAFSPLPNGRYTIDLPNAGLSWAGTKLHFDKIKVDLTGETVPMFELKPRSS